MLDGIERSHNAICLIYFTVSLSPYSCEVYRLVCCKWACCWHVFGTFKRGNYTICSTSVEWPLNQFLKEWLKFHPIKIDAARDYYTKIECGPPVEKVAHAWCNQNHCTVMKTQHGRQIPRKLYFAPCFWFQNQNYIFIGWLWGKEQTVLLYW